MTDDTLHDALREIGADLPEPAAPDAVRRRVESIPMGEHAEPRARPWGTTVVSALGAVAAMLALATAFLVMQNNDLRRELDVAQSNLGPSIDSVAASTTPLVAISFFHEQCPVAGAVEPLFAELKRVHGNDQVLFITLDVTEASRSAQASKLVEALGCGFIMNCSEAPATSGTIMLADMRSREVIKAAVGAEGVDDVEEALDVALATCAAPGD